MQYEGITRVLDIHGFFASEVEVSEGRVDIRLGREAARFRCGRCGQVFSVPHDTYEVHVQDLRMTGRVRCCRKEPEVEHLSWVEKNDRQTIRLKWGIYEECKHTSVSAVAARHRLSWETVKGIDKEMIEARLKDRDLSGLRRLAIDEVSLAKRHKYLTVVTDLDERKVVWVGKGRKSKNLNTFLRKLPEPDHRVGAQLFARVDETRSGERAGTVQEILPDAEAPRRGHLGVFCEACDDRDQ